MIEHENGKPAVAARDWITRAAAHFGTPLYLYDADGVLGAIERLNVCCEGFDIRYAVKTNPNPWLLRWFKGKIASLDVSSSGEMAQALAAGWSGDAIEFTGPAKTRDDLKTALDTGIRSIVVEDLSEVILLNEIAGVMGVKARILVRIAPALAETGFAVRLAGRPTQFGVDEDKLPAFFERVRTLEYIDLDGFHIYSGSQCLDGEAMAQHFWHMWQLFKSTMALWGKPVSELVFGAGMGIPYHEGDQPLDLSPLKPVTKKINDEIAALTYPLKKYIEVGRYLVGDSGLFITRVVRVKESRGTNIVICDGGMNHNLGACGHLGGVSHRHYVMDTIANREGRREAQQYRVVGPLCTAIDTLAHRVQLPVVQEGDIIAVSCAGSYGPSASPLFFISHKLPKEVVSLSLENERQLHDISWLPGSELPKRQTLVLKLH